MTTKRVLDIDAGSGNTGKTRIVELLLELPDGADVLDVGVAGPRPLEFWRPVFNERAVNLTGIDYPDGIARTRVAAKRNGWDVRLLEGTGYDIPVENASFDAVVATQVLEHVARPRAFFGEVARVLRIQGDFFLTLDSAHFCARYPITQPKRLLGNVVKRALAAFGDERHYDLPWYDREVASFGAGAGFRLIELGYYCLGPVKPIQNRLGEPLRSTIGNDWYALERSLNDSPDIRRHASAFRVIAAHFRKL